MHSKTMDNNPGLRVDQFAYDLPETLIAQEPCADREMSRLLVMDRRTGAIEHGVFRDIDRYLVPGDLLVLNDVKVIPARLYARRLTGARIQVTVLDGRSQGRERKVLMKPARRIMQGEELLLQENASLKILKRQGKEFVVRINGLLEWSEYLARHGLMPLPPYIKRQQNHNGHARRDRERYQTVFAVHSGAVAAPTAGLHFTTAVFDRLKKKGIECVTITLWVGWGTFRPLECLYVADHRMDKEFYTIPVSAAQEIQRAKNQKRRVIAVGTTTTRALESWARTCRNFDPIEQVETELFITPGFDFRIVDALITNFHLPESSLIMLVSAFGGTQNILDAYRVAVQQGYRFYSYGDAMIVL